MVVKRRGLVIDLWEEQNQITVGSYQVNALLAGGSGDGGPITQMGFGIGTAAAAPGNAVLTDPVYTPFPSVTYPTPGQVAFGFLLDGNTGNGLAISEFGLLTAGFVLYARKVRAVPLAKDSTISLSGTWTLTF